MGVDTIWGGCLTSLIALLWKHPQTPPSIPCSLTPLVRMDWSRGGHWTAPASIIFLFAFEIQNGETHTWELLKHNTLPAGFWWKDPSTAVGLSNPWDTLVPCLGG